jgi:hypothetical protein
MTSAVAVRAAVVAVMAAITPKRKTSIAGVARTISRRFAVSFREMDKQGAEAPKGEAGCYGICRFAEVNTDKW